MSNTQQIKIQMHRGTAASFKNNNPVLLAGEWALETDTRKMKIGDGTTAYNSLEYFRQEDNVWKKPAEWVDIRSGALPNSAYFLVGHSADYCAYPAFSINAIISNDGAYDVYVDGIKQASAASGTDTTLNWQTLALTSGYDVTYPSALKTHIVRVTPSISTNEISNIQNKVKESGILWCHLTVSSINLNSLLNDDNNSYTSSLCEALTCNADVLTHTSNFCYGSFNRSKLYTLPTIDFGGRDVNAYALFARSKLNKIKLKNGTLYNNSIFDNCTHLKTIETDNCFIQPCFTTFGNCNALEKIPGIKIANTTPSGAKNVNGLLSGCTRLNDFNLDLSDFKHITRFTIGGTAAARIDGLKSITVSAQAPFDSETSPQLDVSYTGLSRAALVNLFKSMPYNVGYEVVGSPTITSGVVSGFSDSNYLVSGQSVSLGKNFEIQTAFTVTNFSSYHTPIAAPGGVSGGRMNLQVQTDGKLAYWITDGADGQIKTEGTTVISVNTKYYVKLVAIDGNYVASISTDGINFTTDATFSNANSIAQNVIWFGKGGSTTVFNGSIDLNNTYIKVNGTPWFTGKAAMIKTCDVCGCAGTADLTQADKDIALNKGWSLTLS